MEKQITLKESVVSSAKTILNILPILFSMILLISIATQFLTKSFYANIFQNNIFLDPLLGSILGSISAGAPVISYIFGGEMLKQGVSLIAITAFMVSWVTVGVLTFPIESKFLGKRFALIRNIIAFIFSIIVAIVAVSILNLI